MKAAAMPHDPHLADLMRQALAGRRGVSEQAMFGGYCWMLNGNMLCGVEVGRFMFRVGKALEAEALAKPGCERVDFSGRPMGGIVWVDADACLDAGLDTWIDFASRYAGGLPPKPKP
jgi:TfoX/Sxy family transcriptional regulator of competence genes